jgi:hypothetical protein
MITRIIHIRDSNKDANEVYIGRDKHGNVPLKFVRGYWGNPVVKGKKCPGCGKVHESAGDTLNCYEQYLIWRMDTDSDFANRLQGLFGKTLVCYCCPPEGFDDRVMCHGQIMIKYIRDIDAEVIESLSDVITKAIDPTNRGKLISREEVGEWFDSITCHDDDEDSIEKT